MNDITITLTGQSALDYIRNDSLLTSTVAKISEENMELHLKILELKAHIAELTTSVSAYALEKAGVSFRLKRDTELMQDSQYEKKSPFVRPAKTEPTPIVEPTLDDVWRTFVDAGEPAVNSPKSHWSENDSLVVKNAINKTDPTYYSVEVLARMLNRSIPAIRTRAITTYGAHICRDMIVSEA